ncbi:hypothetical protein POM88_013764 [Heracleum sosnowskyi]|uniref:Exportin-7/Ran-binding protein 17 TPR repeats domain-containing protein n=1 Tax=Heracleum sosnowskyi TaxID=360622 RepID=A0AAD8J169_9APIA|nr:hypothetical protein POM88_013764 [Heracleum sosnowskyi]
MVSDSAIATERLYSQFSELLGVGDHLEMLNVIVGKIVRNLKCYVESEDAITRNLDLFLELASGTTFFYTIGMLVFAEDSTIPAKLLLQLATAFKDGGLCDRSGKFFYKDHLHKSNVPVLAVAGDKDLICPIEAVHDDDEDDEDEENGEDQVDSDDDEAAADEDEAAT